MGRRPGEIIRAAVPNRRGATVGLAATLAALTVLGGAAVAGPRSAPAYPREATAPPAAVWAGWPAAPKWLHVPQLPRNAWVTVPVATVWTHPFTDRPVDAPAVSSRPNVPGWLTSMSVAQKLGLDNLLSTQALLYQKVVVLNTRKGWDQILVSGQTGSVFPLGIDGWVPASQLTFTPPPAAPLQVTVAVPGLRAGPVPLSYGTQLPAERAPGGQIAVRLPQGRFVVPAASVRVSTLTRSGPAVVAEARRFVGLQYLWAGTSSFGFDCSGLTYTVYRQFGLTLPRDAADQMRAGRPVAPTALQPGDLVFFAFGPSVDHVGIYAGNGLMIDAPHTGAAVEVVPLWTPGLAHAFAGGRRYL